MALSCDHYCCQFLILKVIDFCLTAWTRQSDGKFIKIIPVDDKAAGSIDACK
jgi:hypothetical protein